MLRYARSSIGLLTNAVQALAGVLLPSDTVFLRLLCKDRAVLGPWVDRGRGHGWDAAGRIGYGDW